MTGPSRPLDAAIAVAILLGLGALAWAAVGAPLADWRARALAERPRVIAQIGELQARIADLRADRDRLAGGGELDVLWRAAQTGEATARLQSELSRLASDRGVSLRSISPMRTRDLTLAQAAGFRLEMEAALDQLASFLRDVEYHSPALVVDRASLGRLDKAGPAQPQPLLFAQVEISGTVVLTGEPGQ